MRFRRLVLLGLIIGFVFSVTNSSIIFAAPSSWSQSNWVGGSGQNTWSDNSKYASASNVVTTTANKITIASNSNWFDLTWKYRQSVAVTNSSGSTLTDYQIPLIINTASLITASKMKGDCGDLRVTDSSGNILPYWIATSPTQNTCNQTTTKIWVKASSISTSGETIYLYYGNSDATSLSSGGNVFTVFADFTSGSALPSGWTKTDIGTSGSASVGSGQLSISNTNGADVWVTSYGATHAYNNSTVNGSYIAETLITSQTNSNEWAKSGISSQNSVAAGGGIGQAFLVTTPNNGFAFQYQSLYGETCSGGSCPGVVAANVNENSGSASFPAFLRLVKDGSNQMSGYISSNGIDWSQQGSTFTPWGISANQYLTLFVTPHSTSATTTATFTFFYVRKFASTEPVAGTPTNEQKTYFSSGSLTSSVFDTELASNFGTITYTAITPSNTTITVKARTSNNADMSGTDDFSLCDAITSNTDISPNNCVTDQQRYIQYQVVLSSSDQLSTPTFQSLSIEYEALPRYTVSYTAGAHGSISGSASQTVSQGGDATAVTAVPDTGYHFTNWSDNSTVNPRTDQIVLENVSVSANFAANDTNAPVISLVTATPASQSASITWTTDEVSSSKVQYGLSPSYGFVTAEADTSTRVTAHTNNLVDLKSCARYYYRVISKDATNNQAVSAQQTFNTTGCATSSITGGTDTVIAVTGGNVQLVNDLSTVQLSIPDDFASEQATFQLNKLTTVDAPGGPDGKLIANNNLYSLVAVTDSDEQLNSFDKPITFTVSYGTDTEADFDESSLDVYKFDGTNWIKKNCTLDTNANTLTCSLNGFSVYGVLGQTKTSQSNSSSQSSSSSTSSTSSSSSSVPGCGDTKPASVSDLFQIDTTTNTAKLFFTPISNSSEFVISFSSNSNAEEYGTTVTLAREGVQTFTVNLLKPNTIYYFKLRGQNGCMPGDWSNIMKVKTNGSKFFKNSPVVIQNTKVTNTKKAKVSTKAAESSPSPTPIASPIITTTKPLPTTETKRNCFLWWCH